MPAATLKAVVVNTVCDPAEARPDKTHLRGHDDRPPARPPAHGRSRPWSFGLFDAQWQPTLTDTGLLGGDRPIFPRRPQAGVGG
jgi:hypothetical protein